MYVGIKHAFSAITQRVIAVWYEASNPSAEIGRRVLQPPHIDGTVMEVTGLKPVVHRFRFFQSSDGTTLQTLLHEWSIDVSQFNGMAVERYVYQVGKGRVVNDTDSVLIWKDPVPGENVLTDTRLKDLTAETMEVEFRGFGSRRPDEIIVLPSGGIQLTDGETFSDADTITIRAFRQFTIKAQEVQGASYMDVNIVAQSGAFNPATWMSKNNLAAFTGTIGLTTFPTFASTPNGTARFSTYSGAQRYWRLQFASGNSVQYMGKSRNVLYLATNESIELTWKDGLCYVTDGTNTRYERVGEIVSGGRQLIGHIVADGAGGQEFNVADYPRLIEELTPAQTCSYTDYGLKQTIGGKDYYPNQGKYAISADGTKFKVPDVRGYTRRFLKFLSGPDASRFSNGPNSFQKENVNLNSAEIELRDGNGGSSTNPLRAGNQNMPAGFSGMDVPGPWISNKVNGQNHYIRFAGTGAETISDNMGDLPLIVL